MNVTHSFTYTAQFLVLLKLLPWISLYSKFSRGPAVKIPQQIFHLQHPSLVTVAMHGGSLPSLVHPIGMSAQPGSLKTAFYITAYNERSFISVLSKCQSCFNDLLNTDIHTHTYMHTRTLTLCVCVFMQSQCVVLFCIVGIFTNPTYLYSLCC